MHFFPCNYYWAPPLKNAGKIVTLKFRLTLQTKQMYLVGISRTRERSSKGQPCGLKTMISSRLNRTVKLGKFKFGLYAACSKPCKVKENANFSGNCAPQRRSGLDKIRYSESA